MDLLGSLSKYSASQFFLNTLEKILTNASDEMEYKCESFTPVDIDEIVRRVAFFSGIKNWNNINVEFLNNSSYFMENIERRQNKSQNLYLLNNTLNEVKTKKQVLKNTFLDFIDNEININKKYHIRTKDLLKIC